MNPVFMPRYEWNTIPWKRIQVKVFKLQRRIYRASQRGKLKLVHRLQRLLVKSWYARLLAVRRVSQDNTGKDQGLNKTQRLKSRLQGQNPPTRVEIRS
jgi:RNA-directed DNA polymerase